MLKPGDKAPDFALPDQDGNTVTLAEHKGKAVVLYFYPKDNTPGCTREACDFRDHTEAFAGKKAVIFGVSRDTAASHQKFRRSQGLPFSLLSDPDAKVIKAYGVWKEKNMYGKTTMGIERTTFVIDPAGKVAKIFPKVKVEGHVGDVLAGI